MVKMTETTSGPSEGNNIRSEKGGIVGVCDAFVADIPSFLRAFVIDCTMFEKFAAGHPT